jgi:hypothetical protein
MAWTFYDSNGNALQLTGNHALSSHTGTVDSANIANGSIDLAHMSVNSIDSDQYVDGSIDTAHIADNQVTLGKMAGITRGSIIYGNASGDPAALALGASGLALKSDGTDLVYGTAGVGLGLVIALGG